jgi:hypothetical protein
MLTSAGRGEGTLPSPQRETRGVGPSSFRMLLRARGLGLMAKKELLL